MWKYDNLFIGDLENTEQSCIQFHYILQLFFEVDKLRFLVGISISNSQKLMGRLDRKVEGYSRPENHHEPIKHN